MAKEYAIKQREHSEGLRDSAKQHSRETRSLHQKQKAEVDQMKAEHEAEKKSLKQHQYASINHIKLNNENNERSEGLRHRRVIDEQRLQSQKDYQQLASKRQRESHQLKHAAQMEKQQLEQSRDQYKEQRSKETIDGQKNLTHLENENRAAFQRRRSVHAHQHRQIIGGHNKKMEETVRLSESQLKENRNKYMGKERQQKAIHQEQLGQNQQHFQNVRGRRESQYQTRLKADEKFYQDQLHEQRDEYGRKYKHNQNANRASLENQKNRYEEELFKVRQEFVQNQKFYETRKSDPFYQLVDFGAQFEEGVGFYEITAAIPEQEMENVKVHVQPEKISLYAARGHEQEYSKENEKVSTNNAQTVRQEFSLAQPADHEKVVKSYKDGLLTITVPKKGFGGF